MPLNKRQLIPELAWPDMCPVGRSLRARGESILDFIDRSKSYQRKEEAWAEKREVEDELQRHYDVCGTCIDKPARARQRLRERARVARIASRPRPGGRRRSRAGEEDDRRLLRRPVWPDDGPEAHPDVQYAVERLEGAVVGVRAVEGPGRDDARSARRDGRGAPVRPGGVRPSRSAAVSTEAAEPPRSGRRAPARRRSADPR